MGEAMKITGSREKERAETRMTSNHGLQMEKKKKKKTKGMVRMTLNPTTLEHTRRKYVCLTQWEVPSSELFPRLLGKKGGGGFSF